MKYVLVVLVHISDVYEVHIGCLGTLSDVYEVRIGCLGTHIRRV